MSDDTTGYFLHNILNPEPQPGPPYTHEYRPTSDPQAYIDRFSRHRWSITVQWGLFEWGHWKRLGLGRAKRKARRELARASGWATAPSYTLSADGSVKTPHQA